MQGSYSLLSACLPACLLYRYAEATQIVTKAVLDMSGLE